MPLRYLNGGRSGEWGYKWGNAMGETKNNIRFIIACIAAMMIAFTGCVTTENKNIPAGDNKNFDAQSVCRQLLINIMEDIKPEAATVMIFAVRDGKMICRASSGQGMDEVVPRSALRPFVMAAALDEAGVAPDEKFDFKDGTFTFRGREIKEPYLQGEQPLSAVIATPGVIGTFLVMKRIGVEPIRKYFVKAGFEIDSQLKDAVRVSQGSGFQVNAESLCTGWCLLAKSEKFMEMTHWPYVSADMRGRYGDRIAVVVGPVDRTGAEYVLLTMVEGGGTLTSATPVKQLNEIWQKYAITFP